MKNTDNFIPINITKAKVEAIKFSYTNEKLKFSAEVSLIAKGNKKITSIYIGNDNWDEKNNAELPLACIELAKTVREEVEVSVIRFMNSKQNVIEHKKGD